MAVSADGMIDRRNLRRKLFFWRGLVFLLIIFGLIGLSNRKELPIAGGKHIARIVIQGPITFDQDIRDSLEKIGKDENVKGIILSINSPGGSVAASEDLYLSLRELGEKKPIVSFITGIGASGAYIAAMSSDHIIARETAIVGSIGVIMQYHNIGKLLQIVGIEPDSVKSSPLKAEPSGYTPISPEARKTMQALIDDSFLWFKNLVMDRRNLTAEAVKDVSDGRVFSARTSLSLKLIDSLGTEQSAVAWLAEKHDLDKNLPVKEVKLKQDKKALSWLGVIARIAEMTGFQDIALTMDNSHSSMDMSRTGGILAIWNPAMDQ